MPRSSSGPAGFSATAFMYTPWPVPVGTRESKMTMPISGRAAMLRECVASGDETQKNSLTSAKTTVTVL